MIFNYYLYVRMYIYILISKINHGTCHIIGFLGLIVFVWELPLIPSAARGGQSPRINKKMSEK